MPRRIWADIQSRMDDRPEVTIARSQERVRVTAEIFTPSELVLQMLQRLPIKILGPGRTVLDPACGDGQFLVAAKWVKILHFGMSEQDALRDIYGIDIMADNVAMCRSRLGGGTIVVGDALNPMREVIGQTADHRRSLRSLFDNSARLTLIDS